MPKAIKPIMTPQDMLNSVLTLIRTKANEAHANGMDNLANFAMQLGKTIEQTHKQPPQQRRKA